MSDFINASIVSEPATLTDTAIDGVNTTLAANGFPGWKAEDATLAVIILSTVAQIVADVATTSATVTAAIFRAFGTQLLNVPYSNGAAASVLSTWTFTAPAPTGGYTIDAGTAVIIDSQAFYVQADVTTATGATSASVMLVASQNGIAFNGLGGVSAPVQSADQINWVASIVTAGVSSGGQDQEDDDEYQGRLVGALKLQAPRPVTATNFAEFVRTDIAENATGVAVGRSTSIDGYYPAARTLAIGGTGPTALTCVATVTSGSATVSAMTPPYPGAVPAVGATVTGANIAGGTKVKASPAPTSTGFTLTATATGSATGETVTVGAWTSVERCVTTFVADDSGLALSTASMDTLSAWLAGYREVTFLAFVEPPTYTTIYVTTSVHVLDGFDATATTTAVQTALLSFLSPATWGQAPQASSVWSNETTVRYLKLVGVVESVPGVAYCAALTLGTSPSPGATADIVLSGPAPLPLTASGDIIVTPV